MLYRLVFLKLPGCKALEERAISHAGPSSSKFGIRDFLKENQPP